MVRVWAHMGSPGNDCEEREKYNCPYKRCKRYASSFSCGHLNRPIDLWRQISGQLHSKDRVWCGKDENGIAALFICTPDDKDDEYYNKDGCTLFEKREKQIVLEIQETMKKEVKKAQDGLYRTINNLLEED